MAIENTLSDAPYRYEKRIEELEKLALDEFKLLERCYINGIFRKPSSGEIARFYERLQGLGVNIGG